VESGAKFKEKETLLENHQKAIKKNTPNILRRFIFYKKM